MFGTGGIVVYLILKRCKRKKYDFVELNPTIQDIVKEPLMLDIEPSNVLSKKKFLLFKLKVPIMNKLSGQKEN